MNASAVRPFEAKYAIASNADIPYNAEDPKVIRRRSAGCRFRDIPDSLETRAFQISALSRKRDELALRVANCDKIVRTDDHARKTIKVTDEILDGCIDIGKIQFRKAKIPLRWLELHRCIRMHVLFFVPSSFLFLPSSWTMEKTRMFPEIFLTSTPPVLGGFKVSHYSKSIVSTIRKQQNGSHRPSPWSKTFNFSLTAMEKWWSASMIRRSSSCYDGGARGDSQADDRDHRTTVQHDGMRDVNCEIQHNCCARLDW